MSAPGYCVGCHRTRPHVEPRASHHERVLCDQCAARPFRTDASGLGDPPQRPAPLRGARGQVRLASEITPEPVRWLLPGRVPLGAVTILAGDPGLGKSTMAALWAAELSRGRHGDPATSLFVGSEDSPSRVVVPRLMAAGADLERVGFFTVTDEDGERDLTIPDDLPELRQEIESRGARLVAIDPLNAHLSSATDSHKDASLRKALAPLARLAHECDVAVVAVAHLSKTAAATQPLYRLGGSIGYGGLARSVLGFTRRPGDSETDPRRLLVHVKCNLAPLAPTLLYEHVPVCTGGIDTHRLDLISESAVTASEAFGTEQRDSEEGAAGAAVIDALADGPRPSKDVKAEVAEKLGCSPRTVERAVARLEENGRLSIASGGFPRQTFWAAVESAAPVATEPLSDAVVTGAAPVTTGPLSDAVVTGRTPENTGDSAPQNPSYDSGDKGGATGSCPDCGSLLAPNGTCYDPACLGRQP